MSMRTLFIWIIVAGALGGVVLFTRAQSTKAQSKAPIQTTRTLGFDTARTVGLTRLVDNERQVVEADELQPNRWIVRWVQDGMDRAWIADLNKARAGFRSLATANIMLSATDLVASSRGEVVIHQRDGESIRVEFGSNPSGGFTPVRIEERDAGGIATARWFGRIDRSVADVYMNNSVLGWRTDQVFDLPNSSIRQVELKAGENAVALERSAVGWRIVEPVAVQGDRAQIEALVKVLLSLEAASFVDDEVDPQTSGIESPIASVELSTADSTSSIVIGNRADVGGERVYAQIRTGVGSAMVTLATDQLSKLTPIADAYISKVPSSLSATMVNRMSVAGRDERIRLDATRTMGDWLIDSSKADSINREAIERVIRVVCTNPAQAVGIIESESIPAPIAFIEMHGNDASQSQRFGLTLDSNDAGMRLLLTQQVSQTQSVVWSCISDDASASGAWLIAVASRRLP